MDNFDTDFDMSLMEAQRYAEEMADIDAMYYGGFDE